MIGARATIVSGGHSPLSELRWGAGENLTATADGAPIYIGRDCWLGELSIQLRERAERLGANVTVTQGVRIGDGATVAAGSVVVKDIPNRCVAAGNPAKVVRWLEEGESPEEYRKRFEAGDNGGKMGRYAGGIPPPPSRREDYEEWFAGKGRVWEHNYGSGETHQSNGSAS